MIYKNQVKINKKRNKRKGNIEKLKTKTNNKKISGNKMILRMLKDLKTIRIYY